MPDDAAGNASLEIKASPESVTVKVDGNAAERLGQALVDIISPFTNAAGWAGDQLSYARRTAAIRAAAKAKVQLQREGISSANIPPKLFLPWLDGASMETDEKESLADAWAGLFVRAAKSSDALNVSYMDTLKKIGSAEAKLLDFFATDTSPEYSEKFYNTFDMGVFTKNNPLRAGAVEKLEQVIAGDDVEQLRDFIESWGFQGMCQAIFISLNGNLPISTKFFEKNEHVISNLEHLGLIQIRSEFIKTSIGDVEIKWFQITKYAFDFVWACRGVITGRRE